MMNEPIISTRTILRYFKEEDCAQISVLLKDRDVMKTTGLRRVQTDKEIRAHVLKWSLYPEGPYGVWAIESKLQKIIIGWIMLKKTDNQYPELGYMIAKDYWGQGYAYETTKTLIEFTKAKYKNKHSLLGIIAGTDTCNTASIHILLKLGMTEVDEKNTECDRNFQLEF
jgi:[ribosomal protein S5]-alanine N-acetyltransferase